MKIIAVIGAGTMGCGIAQVFAQSGFLVHLIDTNEQATSNAMSEISRSLEKLEQKLLITSNNKASTLSRLITYPAIAEGVQDAQLVVEAATENMGVKRAIFAELDAICPVNCILASNTSSISITEIAAATTKPERVVGMHFMNPVPLMPLVEIIRGYRTSAATTQIAHEYCLLLGKSPIQVQDFPGFVANRILMPMINEAIQTLYEGVAGVSEIDTIMKLGTAQPMGPLELADFIGLDVCLQIMRVLQAGYGSDKYAASPLLIKIVASGNLGAKTGEGFYNWQHGRKNITVSKQFLEP
ncbi:MAG: hypothetical protein RIS47_973 [Bacteroidota bacterium]|jgi:3-hydroxybutyryl-CoA dehydrogenase